MCPKVAASSLNPILPYERFHTHALVSESRGSLYVENNHTLSPSFVLGQRQKRKESLGLPHGHTLLYVVVLCLIFPLCQGIPHLIYWLNLYSSSEIQISKLPLWKDLPAPGPSWPHVHLPMPTSVLCTALSRPHLCIRQWPPCRIHVLLISAPSMLSTQEKLDKCEKKKRDEGTKCSDGTWEALNMLFPIPVGCSKKQTRARTHTVLLGSTL